MSYGVHPFTIHNEDQVGYNSICRVIFGNNRDTIVPIIAKMSGNGTAKSLDDLQTKQTGQRMLKTTYFLLLRAMQVEGFTNQDSMNSIEQVWIYRCIDNPVPKNPRSMIGNTDYSSHLCH